MYDTSARAGGLAVLVVSLFFSLMLVWQANRSMDDPDEPNGLAFTIVGFCLLLLSFGVMAQPYPAWYVYFFLLAVIVVRARMKSRGPFRRDAWAAFAAGWLV